MEKKKKSLVLIYWAALKPIILPAVLEADVSLYVKSLMLLLCSHMVFAQNCRAGLCDRCLVWGVCVMCCL